MMLIKMKGLLKHHLAARATTNHSYLQQHTDSKTCLEQTHWLSSYGPAAAAFNELPLDQDLF